MDDMNSGARLALASISSVGAKVIFSAGEGAGWEDLPTIVAAIRHS